MDNPIIISILLLGFIEPRGIDEMAGYVGGVWPAIHLLFLLMKYMAVFTMVMITISQRSLRVDRFMIIIFMYLLWLVIANFINGHEVMPSISFAIQVFSIILILRYYITNNLLGAFVPVITFWLVLFLLINVFTQIAFPDGLYISDRDWAMWFYGNRNTFIYQYFLCILFATMNEIFKYKKLRKRYFLLIAVIVFSEIYGGSATSAVAILVSVVLIVVFSKTDWGKVKLCLLGTAVSMGLSYVLINLGINTFLVRFVESVFDRNATFTGRTSIWSSAVETLEGHWATGLGWEIIPLNWSWDVSQCHNWYLDLLFVGGIIWLILFLAMTFVSIKGLDSKHSSISMNIFAFVFIGYCVVFLMEARRRDLGIYILLALMFYSKRITFLSGDFEMGNRRKIRK